MILDSGIKRGFIIEGDARELLIASSIPGAVKRKSEGVVRLPESTASWKALRDVEFEYITDSAAEKLNQLKTQYRKHRAEVRIAARKFKNNGKTDIPVPLKTIPYSHQVKAFGFASSLDACALLMDQGTGKTLVAMAVAGIKPVKRIVVVCPKQVKPVWPRELLKHSDFNFSVGIDEPPPDSDKMFWVTNYDKLDSSLKEILKWKPEMVILDEAHRVKNRKANRTKSAIALGGKVKHKLMLSGTILGKCISETWAPFKFLMRDLFGSNFSQFKSRYLKMGGYMNHKVVGYQNEKEYSDKLHSISFRVTKEECLDLPPISYQRMYVEPDSKTKKIYSELDKELYTEIKGEEVSAISSATKQMKLRQVVGGIVKNDMEELSHVSKQKLSCLKGIMEDRVDKKTLIFFSFTHEIIMAQKMLKSLKMKYITLQGSTKNKDRESFEDKFQNDDSISVAIIQSQTGAEGMTLTKADLSIFYSPTFSFINYSQARDRFHRIGQTRPVTVLFIIMQKTVDEEVVDVLESNGQLLDEYLEKRRNYNLRGNKNGKSKTRRHNSKTNRRRPRN